MRWLAIAGLVVSLTLLVHSAAAAAPAEARWALDGGLQAGTWRGTGTGSVASIEDDGVFAGVGFLAVRVRSERQRDRDFRLLAHQDLREAPQGLQSSEAGRRIEGSMVIVHRRVNVDTSGRLTFVDEFTNAGGAAAVLDVVWGARLRGIAAVRTGHAVDHLKSDGASVFISHGAPGGIVKAARVDPSQLPTVRPRTARSLGSIGYLYRVSLRPGQSRHLVVRVSADGPALPDWPARDAAKALNGPAALPLAHDSVNVQTASIQHLRELIMRGGTTVQQIARLYRLRALHLDDGSDGARAFVALNDNLMREAALLDVAWRKSAAPPPLLGSVVAVKDNIEVERLPIALGLHGAGRIIPDADAAIVARLRRLGALVIGKTRLDELAYSVYGMDGSGLATRNPLAPDRSIGGSSAGSAAAVANAFATFALGTDTCDSILLPCAQTGTVGLRPAHGFLEMQGVAPGIPQTDVVGPITRSVGDLQSLWPHLHSQQRQEATVGPPNRRPRVAVWRGGVHGHSDTPGARALQLRLRSISGWDFVHVQPGKALLAALSGVEASIDQAAARNASLDHLAGLPGVGHERAAQLLAGDARSLTGPRGPRQWLAASDTASPTVELNRLPLQQAISEFKQRTLEWMDRHGVVAIVMPTVLDRPSILGVTEPPRSNCEISAWTGLGAITVPIGLLPGTRTEPAGALLLTAEDNPRVLFNLAVELVAEQTPPRR